MVTKDGRKVTKAERDLLDPFVTVVRSFVSFVVGSVQGTCEVITP
jgi:hypothetical protein